MSNPFAVRADSVQDQLLAIRKDRPTPPKDLAPDGWNPKPKGVETKLVASVSDLLWATFQPNDPEGVIIQTQSERSDEDVLRYAYKRDVAVRFYKQLLMAGFKKVT